MNLPIADKNSRVLIVDDNPAIHEDFRKILSPPTADVSDAILDREAALFGDDPLAGTQMQAGFQLESAFQGEEALLKVRRALDRGQPYAMAFMDMRMPPGWDGMETTSRIWAVDPDLQVVICTAYSDCSWDELLAKLGQSDRLVILKKPFENIEALQLANSLTRKWQLLQGAKHKMANLEDVVVERTAQIMQEQQKFRTIFEHSPEGIFQITPDGRFLAANPALAAIFGYPSPHALLESVTNVQTQLYVDPKRAEEFRRKLDNEPVVRDFESEVRCRDGSVKWISETACRVAALDGTLMHFQGFVVDVTQQKKVQKELNLLEVQLRQAQKLESIGQLAAGIAHEINTPIQYIGDNIRFIEQSINGLEVLLRGFQSLADAIQTNAVTPRMLADIEAAARDADIEYLTKEIPNAIKESLQGVSHISHIVRAMKEFSHPGAKEKVSTDLNRAIETTILIARNEWKYVADLSTDLAANLPPVPCVPSEFNQAILNIIVNAAHAVAAVVHGVEGAKGAIVIGTRRNGDWAEIRIADTGTGIPEEIRHRIFDPFFTTKEVGKGTGQGLTIARSAIVDKHGGELTFESALGKGTTFTIRLPISGKK